jgi:hypothetical protein
MAYFGVERAVLLHHWKADLMHPPKADLMHLKADLIHFLRSD